MSQVKIIRASDGIAYYDALSNRSKADTFIRSEMTTEIATYLGDYAERRFITPFWRAKKLIESSNLNEVAIKLTNYNDPEKIDGEWVVFDRNAATGGGNNRLINRNEDVAYFIFGENLISSFEGGFDLIDPPPPPAAQDRIIAARIGKANDEVGVFFILGEVQLHLDFAGAGAGGGSFTCGAKIPPTP